MKEAKKRDTPPQIELDLELLLFDLQPLPYGRGSA